MDDVSSARMIGSVDAKSDLIKRLLSGDFEGLRFFAVRGVLARPRLAEKVREKTLRTAKTQRIAAHPLNKFDQP